MDTNADHYLKRELHELLSSDTTILDFLQQFALDGLWFWDTEQPEHEWMSESFWRVLGYDPSEKQHLSSEWMDLIYPEDLKEAQRNFELHCADPHHAYDQEVRFKHRDGSTVWVRCRGVGVRDKAGKVIRMLGVHTDITSLKKTEAELTARNTQLEKAVLLAKSALQENENLFENSPDAVIRVDEQGFISRANFQASVIFGYSVEELVGLPVEELVPEHLRESHPKLRDHYHHDPSIRPMGETAENLMARKKDGTLIPVAIRLAATKYKNTHQVIATIRDSSERRKMIETLQEKSHAVEQALKKKSDFLAQISHEVRTPVNGILGMLGALKEEQDPEVAAEMYSAIEQSSKVLLSIIDDLLDASVVDKRGVVLRNDEFSFSEFVNSLKESYSNVLEKRHLNFELEVDPSIPEWVYGDRARIFQAVSNVINNAIKFTSEGYVKVHIEQMSLKKEKLELKITVTDTGIGIDPDNLQRIFNKFEQAHVGSTRMYGGVGLGLFITRAITEKMGGGVELWSEYGVGTVVTMVLYLKAVNKTAGSKAFDVDFPLQGRKVLVAEDNQVNQLVAKTLLTKLGASCKVANDGLEAVQMIMDDHERFDLVFMDCDMPIMDGFEATRKIRSYQQRLEEKPIKIIALTAHSFPEHIDECFDSGMDHHIVKPVSKDDIYYVAQKL